MCMMRFAWPPTTRRSLAGPIFIWILVQLYALAKGKATSIFGMEVIDLRVVMGILGEMGA